MATVPSEPSGEGRRVAVSPLRPRTGTYKPSSPFISGGFRTGVPIVYPFGSGCWRRSRSNRSGRCPRGSRTDGLLTAGSLVGVKRTLALAWASVPECPLTYSSRRLVARTAAALVFGVVFRP